MNPHSRSGIIAMRFASYVILSFVSIICFDRNSPLLAQVLKLEPGQKEPDFKYETAKTWRDESDFIFYSQAEIDDPFRYQLWIPSHERKAGSATGRVVRALIEFGRRQASKDREFWRKAPYPISFAAEKEPLASLDVAKSQAFLQEFQSVLDELHASIDLEGLDQLVRVQDLNGKDIIKLRLEDVQLTRQLMRILIIDIRLAVAEKRFDDAIRSLQAGFKLTEVVQHGWPGLIVAHLINNACYLMMLDTVKEMMQQPECPNMYWALATLPIELGDYRDVLISDFRIMVKSVTDWKELPENELNLAAWRERFLDLAKYFSEIIGNSSSHSPEILAIQTGTILLLYTEPSRSFLKQSGYASDRVDSMSGCEAVLRAVTMQLDQESKRASRAMLLPEEVAFDRFYEKNFANKIANEVGLAALIRSVLQPTASHLAEVDLRRKTTKNQLITVAALQAWAEENPSQDWPMDLDRLLPLPAWPDAYTHANFKLEKTNAGDLEVVASEAIRYEPLRRLRLVRPKP